MTDIQQEEFESLGWEHLGSQWYNLKDVPGKLGYWNYVRLRKWGDNSCIIAFRSNPDSEFESEQTHLFQGDVKNKEDLKKLMFQLHLI